MSKPNTLFKEAYNASLGLLQVGEGLPSEAEIAGRLGISRTTVRVILDKLVEAGLIAWESRSKQVLRPPRPEDYFPEAETAPVSAVIERAFLRWVLSADAQPGSQINEADIAREIGVSTSAVREFLIRFSRFGLIEKQRNRHWVLNGFTEAFALELFEVREMFELRSARAFVHLPAESPIWQELEAIEVAHRQLLLQIDERYREFSELDDRFHRLIHHASSNRFIVDFYDVISIIFHYHYQWSKVDEKERNEVAIREHLNYMVGLRSGNELDAEFFCRKHLASARTTLLQAMRKTEQA
ncbi:GntR family transcriptional regulator [Labrys wisconsinensis]|uniref:DNA-binding GntR family transcriptional regulator n=1 Tax=Labrys wisconsinensis TaxID=425677 RepID=A0ABU0JBE1_9HYPH|nr:GntR family transcriptional regulator [Labrys wisconsinensis]MDQ0471588.1 DNA-binding GntR family transcriptional regulator [Labrys wisconsinensis]